MVLPTEGEPDSAKSRQHSLVAWITFVGGLLLLSLGASPYHKLADSALIAIRLTLIAVLSVLVIRERWQHRRDLPGGRGRPYDSAESILPRMRRWYYGE